MLITNGMIDAAIQRATEAGLFPRRVSVSDLVIQREIMRAILKAAWDAGTNEIALPAPAATSSPDK